MNLVKTESEKEVIAPTVHLNGSGKQSLIDMYMRVRDALVAAEEAISEAHPHGRDYYVQQELEAAVSSPIYRACSENRARLLKLHEIEEEINAIIGNICDQGR